MVNPTGNRPWHTLEPDELLKNLDASPQGLTDPEAQIRLENTGPNSLQAHKTTGPWKIFLSQLNSPLIYLLLAAAAVSLATAHFIDAAVIAGVVLLNTVLGFIQEYRAEDALQQLRKLAAPHARVLRDNQSRKIEAENVVPGDLLLLETGDRVPADARILETHDLQVDESALTGESHPVTKTTEPLNPDLSLGDRTNMTWMSTVVTAGRGKAIVVATGMDSQIGEIAGAVQETPRMETPLQKRIRRLGIYLGVIGVALAAIVFFLGLLRGYETVSMLLFAVAVAVSAIPEGLPAAITIALALGVRRMADRNAIIRRLPAVETLGSTTVICSDKTGTITENQMTVRRILAGGQQYHVTGEGYNPQGQILAHDEKPLDNLPKPLQQLLLAGALCNNAALRHKDNSWQADGNPSEAALLVAARKADLDPDQLRDQHQRIHEIPFSSDRKYMATLYPDSDQKLALVKGAPDRILDYCTHILLDDGPDPKPLDDELRRQLQQTNDDFADQALRVMAAASRNFPPDKTELSEDEATSSLTFLGLWGMFDPPRSETAPAVRAAKQAGIRPILITGDYAATALAIARQVEITDADHALTAKNIDDWPEDQLAREALKTGVFARVSPHHKLKLMHALRSHGHVVAMTGDGVNDAPALKGADIGIAMGRGGTEVAREAADMILTDDNFATIVAAVEEGRVIYSNLRRVVFFLLATNLGEVLTLTAALVIGLPLPLTAVMVLWVNLVTDGAATIPLGVEPRHWDVLKQPPRDPQERFVNRNIIVRMLTLTPLMAAGTLALFYYQLRTGSHAHAQTVAFTTLAAFQWFQALNARSQYQSVFSIGFFSNRWLLLGLSAAITLQVVVIQTPIGAFLFGTTPLSWLDWLLILLVSATIWPTDHILKRLGLFGRPPTRD